MFISRGRRRNNREKAKAEETSGKDAIALERGTAKAWTAVPGGAAALRSREETRGQLTGS